jgi:hypothetical protein
VLDVENEVAVALVSLPLFVIVAGSIIKGVRGVMCVPVPVSSP